MRARQDIENEATKARAESGQLGIPVDPDAVARHFGVSVVQKDFTDDVSGVLVRDAQASTIAVNESHSSVRKRFTVAHECGHYFLGHHGTVFIDKQSVNRRDARSALAIDAQEIEANQFAASLLMPSNEVVEHLNVLQASCRQRGVLLMHLASKFAVSKKAMEYRLVNLGLLSPPDDDD